MWHPAAALSEQEGIGDVFTVKALGYRADFADAVGFHSEKLTVRIACACLAVSPGFHGEKPLESSLLSSDDWGRFRSISR